MNAKIVFGSLGGALVIHALVAACSSAHADSTPAATQVDVENCDKTFQVAGQVPAPDGGLGVVPGTITVYYAEHAYPGLTAAQLAGHVTNWSAIDPTASNATQPGGYSLRGQDAIYVKDGFVGAGCQQGTTSTFVYAP